MEAFLPMGGFQLPFQRRLSRLYNDTKKSSDFVKEPVQNEEDPEIKALHRKLRIQKDRLVSWGLEWSDPTQSAEIDESLSDAGLSEVVGSIMSTIKDILAEAEPLWASSKHLIDSNNRPSGDRKPPLVRWDKSRFEDLVRDLTSSIDTLYDLSRTRSGMVPRRASKSSFLKNSSAEDFKPFESTRRQTPLQIDPQILTHVKPLQGDGQTSRSVVFMSKTAYSELIQGTSVRQTWAPLLLEYATFDSIYSTTGIMPPMARFERLCAGLQQDPQRSPGAWTGLPRLLGYFEDMEGSRLGLVYLFPTTFNAVPSEKPTSNPTYHLPSLKDVLNQPDSEPALEARFRLAHNLVNTVFDLHARGITHGGLNEGNVSFCTASSSEADHGQIDVRRPLLSSFDLFPEDDVQIASITRHPLDPRCTASSPLSKSTDERVLELYSLAMLLLSIGLWTSVENLLPNDSSTTVPESLLDQLAVRCGTLFMKAVQTCWAAVDDELRGNAGGEALLSTVQVKTSRYLEACCILDGVSGLDDRLGSELEQTAPALRKDSSVQSGSDVLKDVKSPSMVAGDAKPAPKLPNVTGTEKVELPALEPTDVAPSQDTKPETKLRLYPHVPLAPDIVEKWNTLVMPQINQALRGFYRKHPESVEISLESIGPTAQRTQPTVLVVCTSVGKVRAILKKRLGELFDGSTGFSLKVCRGQVLRSRRQSKGVMRSMARRSQANPATSQDGEAGDAINPQYQQKPGNGASIGAWIGDRHLPPVSFGGLVMVDDKPYGMTVHHMLDDPDRDFGQDDTTRSMAIHGSEEGYASSVVESSVDDDYGFDLSDSESEDYSDTDLTSEYDDEDYDSEEDEEFEPGDIPGIEPGCGEGYVVTQPALDDVEDGFFPSAETEDEDHLDTFSLGEVYASSGIRRKQANGLLHEVDWALFEFTEERQPHDNYVPKVKGTASRQATTRSNDGFGRLRPTSVAPSTSLPGTEVQCVARTSGIQTGTILPALTSVKIYGRASPSHTYQVTSTPADGEARGAPSEFALGIPGDSGAWIVDRRHGHLCGHVLAWSQRKRVAYICPMDVLLLDIAISLEASTVGLPGGEPVITLGEPGELYPSEKDPRDILAEETARLAQDRAESSSPSAPAATAGGGSQQLRTSLDRTPRDASSRSMSNRSSPTSAREEINFLSNSMGNLSMQSGRGIDVGG